MSINYSNIDSKNISQFFVRFALNGKDGNSLIRETPFGILLTGYTDYTVPVGIGPDGEDYDRNGQPVPEAEVANVRSWTNANGESGRGYNGSYPRTFGVKGAAAKAVKAFAAKGATYCYGLVLCSANHRENEYTNREGDKRFDVDSIYNASVVVIFPSVEDANLFTSSMRTYNVVSRTATKNGDDAAEPQGYFPGNMAKYKGKDGDGNPVYENRYVAIFPADESVSNQLKLAKVHQDVIVEGPYTASVGSYNGEYSVDRKINARRIRLNSTLRGAGVGTIATEPVASKDADGNIVRDENGDIFAASVFVNTRSGGVFARAKVNVYGKLANALMERGVKDENIVMLDCGVKAGAWADAESGDLRSGLEITAGQLRFPKTKNATWEFLCWGMGRIAADLTLGVAKDAKPVTTLTVIADGFSETKRVAGEDPNVPESVKVISHGPMAEVYANNLSKGRKVAYVASLLGVTDAFIPKTGANAGAPVASVRLSAIDVAFLNGPAAVADESVAANAAPVVEDIPESDAPAATDPIGGTDNPADFSKKMSEVGRKALEGAGEVAKKAGAVASDIVGGLS